MPLINICFKITPLFHMHRKAFLMLIAWRFLQVGNIHVVKGVCCIPSHGKGHRNRANFAEDEIKRFFNVKFCGEIEARWEVEEVVKDAVVMTFRGNMISKGVSSSCMTRNFQVKSEPK